VKFLLALGPRLNRHLPEASYALPVALAKVGLGLLLVTKEHDSASKNVVSRYWARVSLQC